MSTEREEGLMSIILKKIAKSSHFKLNPENICTYALLYQSVKLYQDIIYTIE